MTAKKLVAQPMSAAMKGNKKRSSSFRLWHDLQKSERIEIERNDLTQEKLIAKATDLVS